VGLLGDFRRKLLLNLQKGHDRRLSALFRAAPSPLSEFDFRYSNRVRLGVDDAERTQRAIKGAAGKPLTYRQPCNQAEEIGAA
jgi:hypothetical protein